MPLISVNFTRYSGLSTIYGNETVYSKRFKIRMNFQTSIKTKKLKIAPSLKKTARILRKSAMLCGTVKLPVITIKAKRV